MKIEKFEDIEAWQLARSLTQKVYLITKNDGFDKDFGLRDQIRKAAGSIMHNIAEGFDAESNPDLFVSDDTPSDPALRSKASYTWH